MTNPAGTTTPTPTGALSEDERRALVFKGLSNKSLIRRGTIVGLDMAIRIVMKHHTNPLPFLEDELKRQVNL